MGLKREVVVGRVLIFTKLTRGFCELICMIFKVYEVLYGVKVLVPLQMLTLPENRMTNL
jgi:hypothetical protein